MTRRSRFVLLAMIVSLTLAVLSPLASPHPDGLERVVEDHAGQQAEHGSPAVTGLMPDYELAGLGPIGTIAAGLAGTIAVFAMGLLIARLIARRSPAATSGPAGRSQAGDS